VHSVGLVWVGYKLNAYRCFTSCGAVGHVAFFRPVQTGCVLVR